MTQKDQEKNDKKRDVTAVDASYGGTAAVGDGARAIRVEEGGTYIEKLIIEHEQPIQPGFYVPFARHKKFVGREERLKQLHEYLNASERQLVGLVGIGGIGKTQLAVEYLYQHQSEYPDGVFWLNAADVKAWEERLTELAFIAGARIPHPDRTDASHRYIQLLVSYLNTHPDAILVLDDVDPAYLAEEQMPGFLASTLKCRVLFTTRRKDIVLPYGWLDVDALPEEEALDLLLNYKVRRVVLNPNHHEHTDARQLCARLSCLPLLLEVAGAYLHRNMRVTISGYLKRIEEEGLSALDASGLRPSDLPTRHDPSLIATLQLTWDALGDDARRVLTKAALLGAAEDIVRAHLSILTDLPDQAKPGYPTPLDRALAILRDYSLVETLSAEKVRLHPLVQEFVQIIIDKSEYEPKKPTAAPISDVPSLHLTPTLQIFSPLQFIDLVDENWDTAVQYFWQERVTRWLKDSIAALEKAHNYPLADEWRVYSQEAEKILDDQDAPPKNLINRSAGWVKFLKAIPGFQPPQPELESFDEIDFGEVGLGKRVEKYLAVTNVGGGVLEGWISSLPGASSLEVDDHTLFRCGPGELVGVTTVFLTPDSSFLADQLPSLSFTLHTNVGQCQISVRYKFIPPRAEISPKAGLDFGELGLGEKATAYFTVKNTGRGLLECKVETSHPDLVVDGVKEFTCESGQAAEVNLTFKPGDDFLIKPFPELSVRLQTNVEDFELPVRFEITPPKVELSTNRLEFGAETLEEPQELVITNTGHSPLTGTVKVMVPWLQLKSGGPKFRCAPDGQHKLVVNLIPDKLPPKDVQVDDALLLETNARDYSIAVCASQLPDMYRFENEPESIVTNIASNGRDYYYSQRHPITLVWGQMSEGISVMLLFGILNGSFGFGLGLAIVGSNPIEYSGVIFGFFWFGLLFLTPLKKR